MSREEATTPSNGMAVASSSDMDARNSKPYRIIRKQRVARDPGRYQRQAAYGLAGTPDTCE